MVVTRIKKSPVVVIERDPENEFIPKARAYGIAVLLGIATDEKSSKHARSVSAPPLQNPAHPLTCVVHVVAPKLCHLVKSRELSESSSRAFQKILVLGAVQMGEVMKMPLARKW